uniref:Uncharacterized protein n=1 Tax=Oryza barthii TaxID=65489 RepID=A0A0D3GAJ5_9ORYZ
MTSRRSERLQPGRPVAIPSCGPHQPARLAGGGEGVARVRGPTAGARCGGGNVAAETREKGKAAGQRCGGEAAAGVRVSWRRGRRRRLRRRGDGGGCERRGGEEAAAAAATREGRPKATAWASRAERGQERGKERAEADGADGERDGDSKAAIAVVVHGVGRPPPLRLSPGCHRGPACPPAAEPPPLPPRPVGFLPNPSAGLPTQTR